MTAETKRSLVGYRIYHMGKIWTKNAKEKTIREKGKGLDFLTFTLKIRK